VSVIGLSLPGEDDRLSCRGLTLEIREAYPEPVPARWCRVAGIIQTVPGGTVPARSRQSPVREEVANDLWAIERDDLRTHDVVALEPE